MFGTPGVWWAHTVSIVPALIVGSFFDVESGIQLGQGGGENFGNPSFIKEVELAVDIS